MLLDPDFQAAMARRGVTDMGTVQVDAWPAGHFGPDEETGQRLCRAVAFLRPAPGDSEWAHPVDGVIVLLDLNTLEVLRVDDHGVVPIPPESGNFDVGRGCAAARRHRAASDHAARGPRLHPGGTPAALAALAAARRVHAARGPGAEPRGLRGRRAPAPDPVPGLAVGDGGALRRSQPDALLQERLRRRRERRRPGRVTAHPRLRLPGRDRLPGRRRVRPERRAGADTECDLHPRGGRGRAVAAHRVARRLG